jgi:hypothetical protein
LFIRFIGSLDGFCGVFDDGILAARVVDFSGIPSGCLDSGIRLSGGVALLNHRLKAFHPFGMRDGCVKKLKCSPPETQLLTS